MTISKSYLKRVAVVIVILAIATINSSNLRAQSTGSNCNAYLDSPQQIQRQANVLMYIGGLAMLVPGGQVGGAIFAGIGMVWGLVGMMCDSPNVN